MNNLKYFHDLNYTLTNEDTALEFALLPKQAKHAWCLAGSGGRALALLAKQPRRLTCVDISKDQLRLIRLRIESLRTFSHDEFLAFWGYQPVIAEPSIRKEMFQRLKLAQDDYEYFTRLFELIEWQSLLYCGRWEQTFKKLSYISRLITGPSVLGIFECRNIDEQRKFLKENFPKLRWAIVLALLGNASVFNAVLYKGHFPRKNIPKSHFSFYRDVFNHLFQNTLARENFFLQLSFFGKINFPEANPVECKPELYEAAQEALKKTEIRLLQGDLIEQVRATDEPIDFLTCSDVPSYFRGQLEKTFLQDMLPSVQAGGLIVLRHYLRIPENMNTAGLLDITQRFTNLISAEKVGVYTTQVFAKQK
jgi:S-adenosylmethionine-diacylglycerol 3-amino-3-carboxypropyl transferase